MNIIETLLNIFIVGFILFCIAAVIVSFNDGYKAKQGEIHDFYNPKKYPVDEKSDADYLSTQNSDGAPSIPIDHK